VRRGSRVGLSHSRQYSARRSGSGLTYGIRAENGSFLRWGDCNIPHRKKSVQSQGILRQLVPNLVGHVLRPLITRNKIMRRGSRVGLSHNGQYSAMGSWSSLTGIHFQMRIGEEMQRKEKEQKITQIYTQVSVIMGN